MTPRRDMTLFPHMHLRELKDVNKIFVLHRHLCALRGRFRRNDYTIDKTNLYRPDL